MTHKSEPLQYVGGQADFGSTPDKFNVTDDTEFISYSFQSTSEGTGMGSSSLCVRVLNVEEMARDIIFTTCTDDIVMSGVFELDNLVEESPTQVKVPLSCKENDTWLSAGVLHLEYVFYKVLS